MDTVELSILLLRIACSVFIALTLLDVVRKQWSRPRIPGPWSVPVFGSLPFLGTRLHTTLTDMREKYGDIFQVTIGSKKVVVLCGMETVQAALVHQSQVFSGRPRLHTFQLASEGKTMVFNSSTDAHWMEHRRLSERALKMAATLEPLMLQDVVVREAQNMVNEFIERSIAEGSVDPEESVMWSVSHVMYTLCYGDSRVDADFEDMVRTTLTLIGCHQKGNAINFFPWAKYLLPNIYRHTHNTCERMLRLSRRKEDEHLCSYEKHRCRDALDALIRLGVRRSCPLDQDRVLHTVQEYIGAGLDIVYIAIVWTTLYLANFPDAQERIRAEVDEVVGEGRPVCEGDAENMPYTRAFVLELLRHTGLVPFALPHSTVEDTHLQGIFIPKDTFILVNLFSISRDAALWSEPELFKPERFLGGDNSREVLHTKAGFSPYGMGRRRCIGEKMSRSQIFVYLTTLVQRSVIKKPLSVDKLDLTPQFGVVLRPQPFKVEFHARS
ncbi:hypothetical protein CAPTEDRAFT_121606 [Capitella teleta]|uniref:unspecific monooxygenase n=1 Tax=Capitella teleta TaxID=283909 RepID=R7TXU4_CAPTE|nr:hypothetical protein CAPTEDRAFT_121606 [Capitella teleta]|eukprot:ELT98427.1 hypothetical protein CAPTEDRAFT_121606 [Capitella teleta]